MQRNENYNHRKKPKQITIIKRSGDNALLTSDEIETALGYIPADAAAPKVDSFNTRTGAVVLNATDISNALGYSPVDGSTLGYFATGTDAANLTGTVAAARIADGSLSIAKTSGLQAALDSKLTVVAGSGAWAGVTEFADDVGFVVLSSAGSAASFNVTGSVGGLYGQNNTASVWWQYGFDLNAHSRLAIDGSHAFEFGTNPYVGTNVIFHAGNHNLTGDVTSVALATTIANGAVSLAKMANVNSATVFYRKTAGAGVPEVQTLATLKTDLGLTGTNSGDQTIILTGDVTGSGTGSFATTIGANKVTRAMLAATAGARILGATAAGNVTDLTGTQTTTLLDAATTSLQGVMSAQDKTRLDAMAIPYRTIIEPSGSHTAARVAGTYWFGHGQPLGISGTGTLYPADVVYIDPADYPAIGTLTAKLRLRIVTEVNDVAPTGNYTYGLYPVTRPATSGGAGLVIYTMGTVLSGSTVALNTPAADSQNISVSADFALPASAGFYVIGVVTTAAVAASSHLHMSAMLQLHYT